MLVAGPTGFILGGFVDGMGVYLGSFFELALYRGDAGIFGSPGWWTVFFWGWFLGYGPLMAIFIARISRGRSIRSIIVMLSLLAPVVTNFWFTIIGGSGIAFELAAPGVISGPFEGFNLPAGTPTTQDLDRLAANVPLQEAGRIRRTELSLSRANRSVRLWQHVVDRLAQGLQPDPAEIDAVGYLMRTTAVYGSGKFGAADRADIAARPELAAPFQVEMLIVWLSRQFTVDIVEHLAVARAGGGRSCGIATLAVCHSHTCTSLGFFTEQIAQEGLIGIGFTNASAIVAGPGGRMPILGTNPIAFTLPGADGPAMHADFSTAAVALGKITMAKAAGETIPLGWAVDSEGTPTTDPEAALSGALVSAASYKGWALGLLVEFMAAGLTGSRNSRDVKGLKLPGGPPHDLGQTYILVDPITHGGNLSASVARVAEAIADDPQVRIPGVQRALRDPVEVAPKLWEQQSALAEGHG